MKNLSEKDLLEKSPQEITSMLYKSCIEKLRKAIDAIDNKNYGEANRLLQKCNDIIYRLGAGLKYEVGPIADQLDNLYNYMAEELIDANIKKDSKSVEVVLTIMKEISEAWDIAINIGKDKGKINDRVMKYEQNLMNNLSKNAEGFQCQK